MRKFRILIILFSLFAIFGINRVVKAAPTDNVVIRYFVDGVLQAGETTVLTVSEGATFKIDKRVGAEKFVFWTIDGAVRKDLPEDPTLRAKSIGTMNLDAYYVSDTKWAVVFMDSNLKILGEVEYFNKGNGTPTPPATPTKTMLNCVGWALIDDYETVVPTPLPTPTANTFYVAKYELKAEYNKTRNVTVNGGIPEAKAVGSVVTVSTSDPHFSYWIDANTGAVLSHRNPYKFTLLDQDIALESIHGKGDKSNEPMVSIRRLIDPEAEKDIFIGQFDSLDSTLYDIVQYGFIHSSSPESYGDMQSHFMKSFNPETNEFMITVPKDPINFPDNDYKMRAVLMYYQKGEGIPDSDRSKVIMNKSHYEIKSAVFALNHSPSLSTEFYLSSSFHSGKLTDPNDLWDLSLAEPVTYDNVKNTWYVTETIVTEPGIKDYQYKYMHKRNWLTEEQVSGVRDRQDIEFKNERVIDRTNLHHDLWDKVQAWRAVDVYRVYIYDETPADWNLLKNPAVDMTIHYWNVNGYPNCVNQTTWGSLPSLKKDLYNGYWYYDIPTKKLITDSTFKFGMGVYQRDQEGPNRAEIQDYDLTKPYSTLVGWDIPDNPSKLEQLPFVEGVAYQNDFETYDGFASGDTYSNILSYHGSMKRWGIYYGNISTDPKVNGMQSLQLRWDSSNPSVRGYAFTDFELERVNKVEINHALYGTTLINLIISISNDGGKTWVGDQEFTLGFGNIGCTYIVPEAYRNDAIRIKFSVVPSEGAPEGYAKAIIDNVRIYGNVPNTYAHQADVQLATISLPSIITEDGTLPQYTQDGTSIRWGAEPDTVIDPSTNEVHQPAPGQPNVVVKLTADVKKGNVTRKREFYVTVPALENEYTIYLVAGSDSGTANYGNYLTIDYGSGYQNVLDELDALGYWSGKVYRDYQKGFGQDSSNYLTYTAKSGYYIYSIQVEGYTNNETKIVTLTFAGQTLLSHMGLDQVIGETVIFPGETTTFGNFIVPLGETVHITKIIIVCKLIPNP